MSNPLKATFLVLRIFTVGLLLIVFHLFVSQSYAVQPVAGSWMFVGLSGYDIASTAVDPTNPDILYAGTEYKHDGILPGIFKSIDGGNSWTPINNGLPNSAVFEGGYMKIVIDPSNHNVVYAGVIGLYAAEGIFKSIDGGDNWTNITPFNPNGANPGVTWVYDIVIDPSNTNTIYIAGAGSCNKVWKSTDAGASWTQTPIPYCDTGKIEIDPVNPSTVYAIGNFPSTPGIYKSIDGASSWNLILSSSDPILNGGSIRSISIDPFNTNIIYAGGTSGIYKSTDNGGTWILQAGSPPVYFLHEMITDPVYPNTVYAATGITPAYQTIDAGVTWNGISNGWPGYYIKALLRPSNDANVLYAGREGADGGVYVYGLQESTPEPITVAFNPQADSYVRSGKNNRNYGGSDFMRLQSNGDNRGLVRFDQSELQSMVGNHQVLSAKLRLIITGNGNNWGATGRTVDIHRLTSDWLEGNGTENSRGTDVGATWNCGIDSNIANMLKNCNGINEWEMGQPNKSAVHPWEQSPTDTVSISNNQSGVFEYDVTTDIKNFMSGASANYGWIIKKTNERQSGEVSLGTRESSSIPQLVVTYQP